MARKTGTVRYTRPLPCSGQRNRAACKVTKINSELAMLNVEAGPRRSTIDIIHDILSLCDKGQVDETGVMRRCRLSHAQLQRYVSFLSAKGLIRNNDSGRLETTIDGQKTLRTLRLASNAIQGLRDVPA